MKAFVSQFNFPTLIRLGTGAVRELTDHLKTEGFTHPLIVTEPSTAALDFFTEITRDFSLRNQIPEVFCHSGSLRSVQVLEKGAEIFNSSKCDCIVAIGGRQVASAGRGIALRAHHPGKIELYDEAHGGEKNIINPIPHLVVIPVATAGSELWRHAELVEEHSFKKTELFSPRLMAKVVFADPAATTELPGLKIRECKMEIMTTLLEAWLSILYHPICDGVAAEGLAMLFQEHEQTDLRNPINFHQALTVSSLMAGVSIQKGSGLLTAISEAVANYSGCARGAAASVLFSVMMNFTLEHHRKKLQGLATRLGWQERTEFAISRKLNDWTQTLALPSRLSELGIQQADLDVITEIYVSGHSYFAGPEPVTGSEIRSLLGTVL